jgi:hypothetical protein
MKQYPDFIQTSDVLDGNARTKLSYPPTRMTAEAGKVVVPQKDLREAVWLSSNHLDCASLHHSMSDQCRLDSVIQNVSSLADDLFRYLLRCSLFSGRQR